MSCGIAVQSYAWVNYLKIKESYKIVNMYKEQKVENVWHFEENQARIARYVTVKSDFYDNSYLLFFEMLSL